MIITNALVKKSDKVPPGKKDCALKCKKDYEQPVQAGKYYGEGEQPTEITNAGRPTIARDLIVVDFQDFVKGQESRSHSVSPRAD